MSEFKVQKSYEEINARIKKETPVITIDTAKKTIDKGINILFTLF